MRKKKIGHGLFPLRYGVDVDHGAGKFKKIHSAFGGDELESLAEQTKGGTAKRQFEAAASR
ncbi:MAG: hypothetical protein NVS9B4_18680 [Candidatus Acidiferrum sp.]